MFEIIEFKCVRWVSSWVFEILSGCCWLTGFKRLIHKSVSSCLGCCESGYVHRSCFHLCCWWRLFFGCRTEDIADSSSRSVWIFVFSLEETNTADPQSWHHSAAAEAKTPSSWMTRCCSHAAGINEKHREQTVSCSPVWHGSLWAEPGWLQYLQSPGRRGAAADRCWEKLVW